VLGGLLMLFAVILHAWARNHLRELYSERVEVQRRHHLVDSGPYRIVRHPAVVSIILFAAGIFLTNPGLVSLFVLAFAVWDLTITARREEALLSQCLKGYESYMKSTPAFFPRAKRNQRQQV